MAGSNIVAKNGFNSFSKPSTNGYVLPNKANKVETFFNLNNNSIGFKILKNLKSESKKGKSLDLMIKQKMEQDSYMSEYKSKHSLDTLEEDYMKISDIRSVKTDHIGLGFTEYGSNLYMDQEDKIEQ